MKIEDIFYVPFAIVVYGTAFLGFVMFAMAMYPFIKLDEWMRRTEQ